MTEVQKSSTYWISAWILRKEEKHQYSGKKQAWFDENGHQLPTYTIERHAGEGGERKVTLLTT